MSLIKEDGSIVAGANSYCDVEDGDAYAENGLYSDAWFNAGTATTGAGAITPESNTVALPINDDSPIAITFDNEKANDDYEPYIWFSSTDATPDEFSWISTAQSTTGMTIQVSPAASTANSVMHWRVRSVNADPDEITDKKETALIMATRLIDAQMEFDGYRVGTTQALEWPRQYVQDSNSLGYYCYGFFYGAYSTSGYYPNNAIPKRLKDATCELAMQLLKTDRTKEYEAKGLSRIGLGQGALDITFDKSSVADRPSILTDLVRSLLEPFGNERGRRTSARVIRA